MLARVGLALGAVLAVGCSEPPCSGAVDAGTDGFPSGADVSFDATFPDAGVSCPGLVSGSLVVDHVWLAEGPAATRSCDDVGGSYVMHVFDRATGAEVHRTSEFTCVTATPPLAPGEYDVAIESVFPDGRWLAGASRLRPERCTPVDGRTPPYCPPLRLTVGPCEERYVFAVLYCDDGAGAPCPAVAWPWEIP